MKTKVNYALRLSNNNYFSFEINLFKQAAHALTNDSIQIDDGMSMCSGVPVNFVENTHTTPTDV